MGAMRERVRVFFSRLTDLPLKGRRDEQLSDEIEAHLQLIADQYVARGMNAIDARVAARRDFGRVEGLKAEYRDQRGLLAVDTLIQDVRFAARLLGRDRGFTIAAIAVLGLGIGVNNMLFTILYAHTIRGLPIHEVDRVIDVSTTDDRGTRRGLSFPDFEEVSAATQDALDLAAFVNATVVVGGNDVPAERLDGAYVSASAFDVVGITPVLGRSFTSDDDVPGAAAVVALGRGVWQSRFGAAASILGESILVNGSPATVVGVMPDRSGFPSTADIWRPMSQHPSLVTQSRDARTLQVFGRLRDGIGLAEVRAEIETMVNRLAREPPETSRDIRAHVAPINERYLAPLTHPAWIAFGVVGCLIVLISCANVANLMIGRSLQRTRELAIRTSLGATRSRLVRQLLVEGSVLAGIGGCVGLGVAALGVSLFKLAIPEGTLPYWFDFSLDSRVLAALVTVSVATIFLFALLPALQSSTPDVNRVLKDGGREGSGRRSSRRWTTAFLTVEFALASILLAQIAMTLRIAPPPLRSDHVMDTPDVLTGSLALPAPRYATASQRLEFYRALDERLRAHPDVTSVAWATVLPLSGGAERRLTVEGHTITDSTDQQTVWTIRVSPHYFETLGLGLVRGREFVENDGDAGRTHAIINERLARQVFHEEDPIGRRIAVSQPQPADAPSEWLTIVGVAPEIRQRPFPRPDPIVYLPYRGSPPEVTMLLMRGSGSSETLPSFLRREVMAIDPNIPVHRLQTMARVMTDAQWNPRLSHKLIVALTCIAVGLATVGLYAVTAHSVSQRTQEIGVRMALGARPIQVIAMIARRAAAQLGCGFLVGVVCIAVWDSAFSSGVAEVRAYDPQSLITVAAILGVLALIACTIPARRAIRLDPVAAIRHE